MSAIPSSSDQIQQSGAMSRRVTFDQSALEQFCEAESYHQTPRSTCVSISVRRTAKSIGLVSSASVPSSSALRFVSASPYTVIMITGVAADRVGLWSPPLDPAARWTGVHGGH
jgi:hypothetical protein